MNGDFHSASSDTASSATVEDGQRSQSDNRSSMLSPRRTTEPRHWRDVFWLVIFGLHLLALGFVLALFGINRFRKPDRLKIDRYTYMVSENQVGLTETYWPIYGVAGAVGTVLGWIWLLLLGSCASQLLKVSVHILTTYLSVVSVLCFWGEQFFWGIAFAVGATLQFLYVMAVLDRLPFTMLVLQKAVRMVWNLPEVMRVAYAFMLVMLSWMVFWSFGVAGVVASSIGDGGRWWLLVVLSVSLFWTGAVFCNTVHVVVSGMVFLVLNHGGQGSPSMPQRPLVKSLRYAVTTSFGSICYGSLFTAAIRTLRWEIRGIRSKIGSNECLLCCVDFLFHLVETLVRFFNKYAYVEIAVNGKSFNRSARDAWELFQSTGIEALVAYDCSGAVLLMGAIMGGLVTGTCAGVWAWFRSRDRVIMVGSTSALMGMILLIFQNKIVGTREAEFKRLKKERDDRISQLRAERRHEREIKRKLLFYLKSEEERLNRLQEEEEARKREESERRKKEEAERKAKLDEIAERQRQRERELEERERLRREALLRPPEPTAKATEPAPAARPSQPVAAAAAAAPASAPTPGRYVPKFRRSAEGGQTAAPPPEPDRWSRQDDHPPLGGDRWRSSSDDRMSFAGGGSRLPSSSSSYWSSSRGRN